MSSQHIVTSLTADERETTITTTDGDSVVRIWTAQRAFITRLRRNASFVQVSGGFFGSTEWAEFTIDAKLWNPVTGAKRKSAPMSEQRKAEVTARFAAARAARAAS